MFGVHIRERGQEIEGADAVPRLQSHQTDIPKLVGAIGAELTVNVVVRLVGLRATQAGIVITDHVIGEGDHALTGKVNAAGGVTAVLGIGQATFFPMAMRVKDSREWSWAVAERTVKIS